MKTIIKCGKLFDATGAGCLKENQAILVEDEKIVAVGPVEVITAPDAEVVDLSDKFVMPGMIDLHVHMQFDSAPGEMGGRSITWFKTIPELTLKSYTTANRNLMAGFTTIRNMGSIGHSDIAVRNSIDSGLLKGPRIFACGTPICAAGGHGDNNFRPEILGGAMGTVINGTTEALGAVRNTLKYGANGIKLAATGNDHCPELTYEEMKTIADITNSRNLVSAAHATGIAGVKNAIRAGITTIEHGTYLDDEGMDMMLERGTCLVPTLAAYYNGVLYRGAKPEGETLHEKMMSLIPVATKMVEKARERGVLVGLGTDASTQGNPHGKNAFEFSLLVACGYTNEEVLLMGTKTNAKILRWEDKVGTIEAGKYADVIAFDENPLENIEALMNCSFVMKGGEIFKK